MSTGMPSEENTDIIQALLLTPFKLQPVDTRLQILTLGRPKHNLIITSKQAEKPNSLFNVTWYDVYNWLCGSFNINKLFCWPCLLMRPESSSWSSTGFDDFRKIATFGAKHAASKFHLKAIVEYNTVMAEMGLHSEIADEMKADYSVETESESDSEFLRRFLVPKTHNERKEITENVSKETLTFRAWQQEKANHNKLRIANDPVLVRRKRRLARIEVENAKLTSRLLQLEIQLIESKLEYQRALNGSFPEETVSSEKIE